MLSTLLALGNVSSTLLFGFVVALLLLRSREIFTVLGVTVGFGNAVSIVLMNALGYVLPIRTTFWIVPAFMLVASVLLLTIKRKLFLSSLRELSRPPLHVLLPVVTLILFAGFAYAREEGSDTQMRTYWALPATIEAGNFPVVDPLAPDAPYSYHYGPALLAASFSGLTGLSLAVSWHMQPLWNAAVIVFFGCALGWSLTRSWRGAALCGVLGFAGAGIYWLHVIDLVKDLWNAYVQHQALDPPHETPWRFVTYMIRNVYAYPPLTILNHRPISMGIAFTFGFLAIFSDLLRGHMHEERWRMFVCVVFGLALALTMETTLVAMLPAVGLLVCILFVHSAKGGKTEIPWIHAAIVSLCVFLPVLAVAYVQGGVLSAMGSEGDASSFSFWFDGRIHYDSRESLALWQWAFFRDFTPILLLPFLCIWAWRRRSILALLLCSVAAVHVVIPLVVHFDRIAHEMNRLYVMAISLSSLLFGAFVTEVWSAQRGNPRRSWRCATGTAVIALLLSSALHIPVRLLFPTLRFQAAPLFAALPEAPEESRPLYDWVRTHTDATDRFYMHSIDVSEEMLNVRLLFITHTGRQILDCCNTIHASKQKTLVRNALDQSCDPAQVTAMRARYILLLNTQDEEWFGVTCRKSAWELVFGREVDEAPLPRVYRAQPSL